MNTNQPPRNELADLERNIPLSGLRFYYDPQARLPVNDPDALSNGDKFDTMLLISRRILHPGDAIDGVIRRGKMRVSEFLADGREVTRAILQPGSVFAVRRDEIDDPPPGGGHDLARTVLMALEDTEVWTLPAGRLTTKRNGY